MVDDTWLQLVRIARDAGDVSSLLPPGVKSLYDAPHLFVDALRTALYFLSFEELEKHERPPKKYWLNNDKMNQWWADVEANRRSKSGNPGGESYQSMPENELLKQAFVGRNFRG